MSDTGRQRIVSPTLQFPPFKSLIIPMADYEYLGLIGRSLSVPEKSAVKCSLLVLGERLSTKVQLWGKVMGIHGDYLIAQTVPTTLVEPRLSFYSVDGGTNWVALPSHTTGAGTQTVAATGSLSTSNVATPGPLTPDQEAFCDQIRGRFMGKADFVYKIRKDVPAEPNGKSLIPGADDDLKDGAKDEDGEEHEEDEERPDEEQDEEAEGAEDAGEDEEIDEDALKRKKNKPKFQIIAVSEISRLAHFVAIHDEECRVAVRGAYVLNEKTGQMVKNRTFTGLEVEQARKLRSFLKVSSFPAHYAEKQAAANKAANEAAEKHAAESATAAAEEGSAAADVVVVLPTDAAALADEETNRIVSNNKKWFGPTYNHLSDCLAPLSEDCPQGIWTVKYDATLGVVSVQNLFYPGSLFYYVPESANRFGQLYFGTGERCLDVCFQLPGKAVL